MAAVAKEVQQALGELRAAVARLRAGVDAPTAAPPTPPPPPKVPAARVPNPNNAGSLTPVRGSSSSSAPHRLAAVTLGGWSAADLYLDCMRKYGGSHPPALSPQDKLRATLVIRFFTAMATEAEIVLLQDRAEDLGKQRRTVQHLEALVARRLAQAFEAAGTGVPRPLQKKGGSYAQMRASGIETQLKELRRCGCTVVADRAEFATFRTRTEASGGGGGGPKRGNSSSSGGPSKRSRPSRSWSSASERDGRAS